eukprot:CAMPEP_0177788710 /NCGR_PEP_ID=MMETSP0491_2-20121128/22294_1 /TAXON_ID=63592 /ORGANISM="Tetraselmis chuii, Strain PLY429" /LENGTH=57 /DNA_ID=CAMNT_0019310391 /DNA_START=168 /DNA_END=337 /DNA_ORIENTATION=+
MGLHCLMVRLVQVLRLMLHIGLGFQIDIMLLAIVVRTQLLLFLPSRQALNTDVFIIL